MLNIKLLTLVIYFKWPLNGAPIYLFDEREYEHLDATVTLTNT